MSAHKWVLEHRLADEVRQLRELFAGGAVVLLDYETNRDADDLSARLSHAALAKCHLEGNWPSRADPS